MRNLISFALVAISLCPAAFAGELLMDFAGNGNRDSKSFAIRTGKATVTVTASHSDPSIAHYTSVDVKNEAGVIHGRGSVTLNGEGKQVNQTVLRGEPGTYFIHVISGATKWRVVVREGE
jgi:hypothetical protein